MKYFNHCPPINLGDLRAETFPSGRFYTLEDGTKLPSITTVLNSLPKPGLYEWRQRVGEKEANRITRVSASRGTSLHKICENYIQNKENYFEKAMPDAKGMFQSIRPFLDRIDDVYYMEQALWSKTIGIAGRTDLIAHFDKELSVIDYKNSRRIKTKDQIRNYFIQATFYALAHQELTGIPIKKIRIIMAVEDSQPLLFEENVRNYVPDLVQSIKYFNSIYNDKSN